MGNVSMVRSCPVVAALNREWLDLGSRPLPERFRRRQVLRDCGTPDDVLARIGAEPDRVLTSLIAECQAGHQLAGRIVVQALLGKVILMGKADPRAAIDDYLSALWVVLRTYSLERRSRRVAANVVLDTLKLVHTERRWLRQGEVSPYPPEVFVRGLGSVTTPPEPDATAVIKAAQTLGVVSDETGAVLLSIYSDGLTGASAARRHATTPENIRTRCRRGLRQMAASADQLRAA